MATKIGKLSEAAQEVLRLAACVGATFDLWTISVAAERPPRGVAADLWEAVEEGLISPLGEAYKFVPSADADEESPTDRRQSARFAFVHDRVQEQAYALIGEGSRRGVHLRTGRLLLRATPPDQMDSRIFDVLGQLNRAIDLIDDVAERTRLASLNLAAGRRAKASTAYASAITYFRAGVALLGEQGWEREHALMFALVRERSECEHLTGEQAAADEGFSQLLVSTDARGERAEVFGLRMLLYSGSGRYPEAMAAAREALRLCDVEVPEVEALGPASQVELAALQARLASLHIPAIPDVPEATDPVVRARMSLLGQTILFGAYVNPLFFQFLTLKLVNMSLAEGNAPGSSIGYITYSMILSGALENYELADAFGKVALAVAGRYDELSIRSTIENYYGAFVSPWRDHFKRSDEHLRRAFVGCTDSGAMTYAFLAVANQVIFDFMRGGELIAAAERAAKHVSAQLRIGQSLTAGIIAVHLLPAVLLSKGAPPDTANDWMAVCEAMERDEGSGPGLLTYATVGLGTAIFLGDLERARDMSARGDRHAHNAFASTLLIELGYYQMLLAAALLRTSLPDEERAGWQRLIDDKLPRLQRCAESCPDNFKHKFLLLSAELARSRDDQQAAAELYDQAIAVAAEFEFTSTEALSN
ncbi:MAG: hypothetical protein ABI193_00845, partial [Minicystis sp.]